MPASTALHASRGVAATREDVRRTLGDVDDVKVVEILALTPSVIELEEAAMWSRGEGEVLGKSGHPLTGIPAAIFEIIAPDEEEEPPPPR
ncbi:MAG TPA: hypothetical protein VK456_09500 [Xanthobacteraceae bacterium]|nr:hypothetical protein [Xanthobacteraceae bacterium]